MSLRVWEVYIPRACEFADQALTGTQIGDYPATCNTLQDVLGVPRNQVAIVDDVLLTLLKLFWVSITSSVVMMTRQAHIFADNGSQAADPHDAYA